MSFSSVFFTNVLTNIGFLENALSFCNYKLYLFLWALSLAEIFFSCINLSFSSLFLISVCLVCSICCYHAILTDITCTAGCKFILILLKKFAYIINNVKCTLYAQLKLSHLHILCFDILSQLFPLSVLRELLALLLSWPSFPLRTRNNSRSQDVASGKL